MSKIMKVQFFTLFDKEGVKGAKIGTFPEW
jgi:hypothetical protein